MKKIVGLLIACLTMASSIIGVSAADMNMYVNGIFVVRDLETVGDFDMLPILDIAGELGYQCTLMEQRQSSTTIGSPIPSLWEVQRSLTAMETGMALMWCHR